MYFKTNHTELIESIQLYNEKYNSLVNAATAFAKEFDAEPVFMRAGLRVEFNGLDFNNPKSINYEVWTKPHRQFKYSWLRAQAVRKGSREEWARQKDKWDKLHKQYFVGCDSVSQLETYQSIGFGFGDHYFSRFEYFVYDGFVYIDTTYSKIVNCTEILGSEYEAAHLAFNTQQFQEEGA